MGSNDLQISGSTLVYGVIGDPVDHSLSPPIQNAAFRTLGLNAVYLAFPVRKRELSHGVQGLKSLGVRGFNVTTPHKMMVLRYLDEVETEAAEIGSINTVRNDEGTLVGFNTDGVGALNAIEAAWSQPGGQSVLLLGAGGAARVIAYALAERACSLNLANRTLPRAKRLARSLHSKFGAKVNVIPLSSKALRDSVTQADIILNASSMGMGGKDNPPIDKRWIRRDHCVFDIVYRPIRTKLLQDAVSAEATTITGLDMLLNQGASSFKLWTGRKAPIHEMRDAITEKLILENAASR